MCPRKSLSKISPLFPPTQGSKVKVQVQEFQPQARLDANTHIHKIWGTVVQPGRPGQKPGLLKREPSFLERAGQQPGSLEQGPSLLKGAMLLAAAPAPVGLGSPYHLLLANTHPTPKLDFLCHIQPPFNHKQNNSFQSTRLKDEDT